MNTDDRLLQTTMTLKETSALIDVLSADEWTLVITKGLYRTDFISELLWRELSYTTEQNAVKPLIWSRVGLCLSARLNTNFNHLFLGVWSIFTKKYEVKFNGIWACVKNVDRLFGSYFLKYIIEFYLFSTHILS